MTTQICWLSICVSGQQAYVILNGTQFVCEFTIYIYIATWGRFKEDLKRALDSSRNF